MIDCSLLGFRFARVILAIGFLAMAGCAKTEATKAAASATTAKSPALKIGMSFQELDNPYFAVMKQAFDEAGHSIGAELFVADARHDVTKQINDIEDLVQ